MSRTASNVILVGIVCGVLAALAGYWLWGESMASVGFLGELFLRALRMIVVPLVLASVIVGITGLGDVREIGSVGTRTIGFYALTTGLSVLLGVLLVSIFEPGAGVSLASAELDETMQASVQAKSQQGWRDILLSFLSPNIFEALARPDMLPIIVFSLVFGGVLTTIGERGKPVIAFFDGVNEAIMKIVHLVMWFAPIGIFGLVAARFAEAGSPAELQQLLWSLARYMGVVLLGLAIHGLVTMSILAAALGRKNPITHFVAMVPALLTAWSTASSSGTLPVTMECAEENAGLSERASGFVLPLGATINMDGTALYEAVAAVYIAQAYGIDPGTTGLFLICITATLASIGAAGIPEAGLFTMVIVLQAVGLPLEGIGLILAVDWLLDRFRTTVNVWGDSVATAYVDGVIGAGEEPSEAPAGS